MPDFDVDRLSRAREFQVCASFLNVSFHGVICNLSEPEGVEVEVALNFEFFLFRIGEFYKYEFGTIRKSILRFEDLSSLSSFSLRGRDSKV